VVFHVECNKIFNKFYKPVPILIDNHRMIVELDYDGHAITAVIGADFQRGILGRGHTAPDALRALAAAIEREDYPLPQLEKCSPGPVLVRSRPGSVPLNVAARSDFKRFRTAPFICRKMKGSRKAKG
jgi:hypothetical protein